MKDIKFLFVFSLMAMMFACETDYEPLNKFSDADWYTSAFGAPMVISVDDYMSFSDLSQGTKSHSWSFSDTSGCKFLKGTILSSDKDFYPFIDERLDTISLDKTVHVLFTKGGIQGIRLHNVFENYARFEGNDTLETVYQNGEWVLDTTFMVDVYDSIQPAFNVYQDGVKVISVAYNETPLLEEKDMWKEVDVEFGKTLTFVDLTEKGRPDTYLWEVKGGTPEESVDSAAVIAFNQIGTFTAKFTASRTDENIPAGSKLKNVPIKIHVIPSSEPLVLDGHITKVDDMTLQLPISRGLEAFSDKEGFFTVHVSNTNGFDQDVAVDLAKVNADDITKIDLLLAAPIYDNDVVTVSYDDDGQIKSIDQRELDSIEAVDVVSADVNMMGIAGGFEDALGDVWTENHKKAGATAEYSTEQVASGMYSLKLENEVGEQARVYSNAGSLFSLKAGVTYIVRYKRYLTASADLAGGDKLYIATGTNVAVKQINNVENLLDDVNSNKMCHVFAGKPAESWYAMEFEFTPDEDYNDAYFNLQINPKVGVFYYDDFYIAIKASKRP